MMQKKAATKGINIFSKNVCSKTRFLIIKFYLAGKLIRMQFDKIFFVLLVVCSTVNMVQAQQEKKAAEVCYNPNAIGDTSKRSIKSAAVGKIGQANITINYHSPGVRGRTIWGGLVPYDEVWVTGAHYATKLEIDKDFTLAGKAIPKGKYALFTIPGKNEWTIIINKNWDQHLTDDYLEKEDVVRIKVKPIRLLKKVERLQYFIEDNKGNLGVVSMAWEKVKIKFDIMIKP